MAKVKSLNSYEITLRQRKGEPDKVITMKKRIPNPCCGQRHYVGLGYDKRCGKTASYLLDKTEPVCAECAKRCHSLRVSRLKRRKVY